MIEFQGNLYPIINIRNIQIDRENLVLTIYFKKETGLYPVSETYASLKLLEEKVKLLNGTKRKPLLG